MLTSSTALFHLKRRINLSLHANGFDPRLEEKSYQGPQCLLQMIQRYNTSRHKRHLKCRVSVKVLNGCIFLAEKLALKINVIER